MSIKNGNRKNDILFACRGRLVLNHNLKQFPKVNVAYTRFLGYDKDFVINEEEAETVRLIYKLFLAGYPIFGIKRELEAQGRKTATGKTSWCVSSIESILTNEKYKGDALLQKQYVEDFLTKKRKTNEGEVPQYYVEGHHEAIIDPDTFDIHFGKMEGI